MKRALVLLLGVIAAISGGSYAATGGGFPSRPQFQAVGVGQVAGATGTVNGVAPSDWAQRSTANVYTFPAAFTNDPLKLSSASPFLAWNVTGGAVDTKLWDAGAGATTFTFRTLNDAANTASTWLQATRSAVAISNVSLGNATDNPTYSFLGTGLSTFGGRALINATTPTDSTNSVQISAALPGYGWNVSGGGVDAKLWFAQASSANTWTLGMVNDAVSTEKFILQATRAANVLSNVSLGNATDNPTFTFAGTGTATFGGNVTVSGSSVCRADGTNCPAATGVGANFVGVSTANATRTSTVTTTCDAALTVSIPNVTARYKVSAFLQFQGGGITANGWRATLTSAGGTFVTRWIASASTNTTTTNAAPVSMVNTATDPMTALFNAAGIDTFVEIDGTISVTSPATPTLCVGWAQNTSNATASTLVAGSSLTLTRLN